MPDKATVKKAAKAVLQMLRTKKLIPKAYIVPDDGGGFAMLTLDKTAGAIEVSVAKYGDPPVLHVTPKGATTSGLEKQLEKMSKQLGGIATVTTVKPADDTADESGGAVAAPADDNDAHDAAVNALNLRFATWRTRGGSEQLNDTEMQLMNGFADAMKKQKLKTAAACIAGLEKMAAKRGQAQGAAGTDTYSQMPGAPAGGDDTYSQMPGAPAGGDDTYSPMPGAPAGGDDTYSQMPGPPAGGDDSAPEQKLRDDDDDYEVDEQTRNDLVQKFVALQNRVKAAEAKAAQSLHADKNLATLAKIKQAMEKLRAMLKKKAFVPVVVGTGIENIDKALQGVEKETSSV